MKIIDAIWTPTVNLYVIQCDCGKEFQYRTDRWKIRCPFCYKEGSTSVLREEIEQGQIRKGGQMATRVIQKKDQDDYSPNELVSVVHPSPWRNPYKIGRDGNREEVLEQFESYFLSRVEEDAEFREKALKELKDKVLVCDCDCDSPEECHGHIIAEWVDSEAAKEGPVVKPKVVLEGPLFCNNPIAVQIHYKGVKEDPKEEKKEKDEEEEE